MNNENAQPSKPHQEIDGQSFQFIDIECGEIITTLLVRNTFTDSDLFIYFLEETERYILVELWDEERSLGILPILKDEEAIHIIKNEPIETIAAFIWQSYQDSQSGVGLLNRKRIDYLQHYSSKLNFIAHRTSLVLANLVAEHYLFLAQKENKDTAGLDEWKESGRIPEWMDRATRNLQVMILRDFDMYPEEAETVRSDYWRSVVSVALQDLRNQGMTKDVSRKELKLILNRHIFENDEFDGPYKAVAFCSRALAAKELVRSNVIKKSLQEWNELLGIGKQPAIDRRCKPSVLVFEKEPILPFGVVEEKIRMSWQNPAGSDLEILRGGVHSDFSLSNQELHELLEDSIKDWRNRKSIWQDVRSKLEDPQSCWSFFRWVIYHCRRIRKYMRTRYGIDMARRRVLRKAIAPQTTKDTANRAVYYADAMALETAFEAANFTFDWFTDEFAEAGDELLTAKVKAIKEAAKASLGVLEASPLFHLAILKRTSNRAVKEAENYFLCGIGAELSWWKYPSLYRALSTDEGHRLSGKETYARFLQRLPEAVLYALKERYIGEPLINGRNSFRNKVSQYLRKQEDSKGRSEIVNSELLALTENRQAKGIRRLAADDYVLAEEVRAKIAKEISRSRLSSQQRAIIELKLLEGKSQSEIAEALGITDNHIKSQQWRAFQKSPSLKAFSRR